MPNTLSSSQLVSLFRTVFRIRPEDAVLTIIVDVPDAAVPDNEEWRQRRLLAVDWWSRASEHLADLGLDEVWLAWYGNVHTSNNDLPPTMFMYTGDPAHVTLDLLHADGVALDRDELLATTDLIIAPTEFSATAPCKMLAKIHHFRGATMPGFTPGMIPSLGVDYDRVHARIMEITRRLDRAEREVVRFAARGTHHTLDVDLRFHTATPSSGMFHSPGIVGNLPSGESYIVPYEGEREGVPSRTAGLMPVQFDDEIVVYRIEGNRAVEVLSTGPHSDRERAMLVAEPAYGNIAEMGHGVLGEFGCTAAGNLLMDEKLGLHIAFGRSEHFGGTVSPASFNAPENVVHIDRVYVESLQPDIRIVDVVLHYEDGTSETIMVDGQWVCS